MKIISVLIVVDVVGAQSTNLQDNVYLVDTNGYAGSGSEGQTELKTVCKDTQIISWRVVPISQQNNVEIVSFTGVMVNENICTPVKTGIAADISWEGTVETQGAVNTYQYSVTLSFDGKQYSFDPFIDVVAS